ncbi:MAG: hypothetical protein H8E98_04030 [Bacteroidetes bacterium]|nr:hypothetical protein [Bacteroidota bacterium]
MINQKLILKKWAQSIPNGVIDIKNIVHQANLIEILRDMNIEEDIIQEVMSSIRGEINEERMVPNPNPSPKARKDKVTLSYARTFYEKGGDTGLTDDEIVKKAKEDSKGKEKKETEDAKQKKDVINVSDKTKQDYSEILSNMDTMTEQADQTTKDRIKILKQSINQFMESDNYDDQVSAIREMVEYGLIEAPIGSKSKKIYLSDNTTLPYKFITKSSGTQLTAAMIKIIRDEGIDVPLRLSGGRTGSAYYGAHNESGIASYIFSSRENKDIYESAKTELIEAGENEEQKYDDINKKTAELILEALPEGSKVTDCLAVGGIGKSELEKMGIFNRTDPTDIVVTYKDKEGNIKYSKISAKIYSDPSRITMKNAGMTDAGVTYLGGAGKEIDDVVLAMREKHKWDDSMSVQEKKQKKVDFKKEYMNMFFSKMDELSKTDEGQDQLIKMWSDIHGCGADVSTSVANKRTGGVELKPPNYYCIGIKKPLKTSYDGTKMIIEVDGNNESFIQIDVKTEDKAAPVLLFRHITKKIKKSE